MKRLAALAVAALSLSAHANDDLINQGRALFHGEKVLSVGGAINGVRLPAATSACNSCHGERGAGSREAGVEIPALQSGRLRAARDSVLGYASDTAIMAAIQTGVGRGGAALSNAMPRYDLSDAEQAALAAYLQVAGSAQDRVRGVTADKILFAAIVPLSGSQSEAGRQIVQGVQDAFATVNKAGGVFGRRVELELQDSRGTRAGFDAAMQTLAERGDTLAVVAPLLPELTDETARMAQMLRLPLIAAQGMARADVHSVWVSLLLPTIETQWRVLGAALQEHCGTSRQAWLFEGDGPDTFSAALAQRALAGSYPDLQRGLAPAKANAVHIALNAAALRKAATTDACTGGLAALLGADASGASANASKKLVLVEPMQPQALASTNRQAGPWYVLAQLSARIALEALARSGRDVDGARLAQAVNQLNGFEVTPGLAITYSRSRRHGIEPHIRIFRRESS